MVEQTLIVFFIIAKYCVVLAWAILIILIGRAIFKRDYSVLKIVSLYLVNSITFILAYGVVLKLALLVRAPIQNTKEESIENLRNLADGFFLDFIFFALGVTCLLTVLNIVYLKYFVKKNVFKHTVILLIANFTILVLASYISTEWYYVGLLQEIDRHFN